MSIKHALVVDDSKSARLALKQLLEHHELVVEMAESGEEALEFLRHQTVDVIFMDHTMPGMDGLAAVKAIKSNPRTAMIPVMMYTTKEGEVYVGQARALGAIGVLPKSVQPHVLFDMLLNLGLVKDRRGAPSATETGPQRRGTDPAPPPAPAAETPGFALEGLLRRILDDQKVLRAELMLRETELAKRIAAEVVEAQRAAPTPYPAAVPPAPAPSSTAGWQLLVVLLAIAAAVLGVTAWQARSERDATRTATSAAAAGAATRADVQRLETALHTERTRGRAQYLAALDALQWAINQNTSLPFDALPFDDTRVEQLRGLLERLSALDFRGRVRIEAHLGEFCLLTDETGRLVPASPGTAVERCSHVGHPLDDSSFVADRQTVEFAEFVAGSPLVGASDIELELVAHDRAHSLRRQQFPSDVSRAGEWNRIAEENNRVEYTIVPTE